MHHEPFDYLRRHFLRAHCAIGSQKPKILNRHESPITNFHFRSAVLFEVLFSGKVISSAECAGLARSKGETFPSLFRGFSHSIRFVKDETRKCVMQLRRKSITFGPTSCVSTIHAAKLRKMSKDILSDIMWIRTMAFSFSVIGDVHILCVEDWDLPSLIFGHPSLNTANLSQTSWLWIFSSRSSVVVVEWMNYWQKVWFLAQVFQFSWILRRHLKLQTSCSRRSRQITNQISMITADYW